MGQTFEVSVVIRVDYSGADSIDATVNYAEACAVITRQMQQPSALIEHAAHRIALALKRAFPAICGGTVTLAKIAPPMPYELESVAVTLQF